MLLEPTFLPIENVKGRELHKDTASVHIQVGLFLILASFPLQRLLVLKEGGVLKERLPNAVLNHFGHANDSLNHEAETLDRYFFTRQKKPQSLANLLSHLNRSPFYEDKCGPVRIIFVRFSQFTLLARLHLSFSFRVLLFCRQNLLSNSFCSLLRFWFLLLIQDLLMRTIIILRPAVAGIEDLLVLTLMLGVHAHLVLRSWRRPSWSMISLMTSWLAVRGGSRRPRAGQAPMQQDLSQIILPACADLQVSPLPLLRLG